MELKDKMAIIRQCKEDILKITGPFYNVRGDELVEKLVLSAYSDLDVILTTDKMNGFLEKIGVRTQLMFTHNALAQIQGNNKKENVKTTIQNAHKM